MEGTTGWKKERCAGKRQEEERQGEREREREREISGERKACRWTNATRRATEGDYANGSQFDRSALQITAVLTHSIKCTRKPAVH